MWYTVFKTIQDKGLNFAWLDLKCKPPPTNASQIVSEIKQINRLQLRPEMPVYGTAYSMAMAAQSMLIESTLAKSFSTVEAVL